MTDQTPPTDRPLTAGDVPLLREGDVLRVVVAAARNQEWNDVKQPAIGEEVVFIKPFGSGGVSNCIVTSFDPAFGYRPGRFTFVSRPATSAASEGEGDGPVCMIAFREGKREPELISWNKLPVGEHRLYLRNRTSEPEAGAFEPKYLAAFMADKGVVHLNPAPATADKLKVAVEALEKIADEAPYRSGHCQSDVEYGPKLSDTEMQSEARQALAALNE